ncbi:glycosyltransferase family 61 protein [Mesobacillus campisalis]|uniref:glycosyltransferase family 61 protein n=1 Tax=Mesobacillus campisalis TaxID=1408103 RepID=UPI00069A19E6|nr:glycosyltransferase family 61 protein [Mesobacillus campisalis]
MSKDICPPKKIYTSTRDWLSTISKEPFFNDTFYKIIYPASPFSMRIKHPPAKYPKFIEGGSVTVIPNGRVWGLNGAIITPDNNLIWDVSLEFVNPQTEHSIFKEQQLPPITNHYKEIADLTHIAGSNYYHWMYEVIPRLYLLNQSNIKINQFILNFDPYDLPFQKETLYLLGIKKDQINMTHRGFHIQAERLVVPSQPSYATKWAYDFLRKTFLNEAHMKRHGRTKIYISRKNSRKIINEDELFQVLSKYGFIKIELETLPVVEQVQLFSSAEVIIAPHGAGLTNLTFCRPGTKVLEIFSPTYITSLYWVISSFGNLKHEYFIGQGSSGQTAWNGLDNIKINMSRIMPMLKKMGL